MTREANNHAIDELRALLLPVAAANGCYMEVDDRRGAGVVGINWRCEDGGVGWQQIELSISMQKFPVVSVQTFPVDQSVFACF